MPSFRSIAGLTHPQAADGNLSISEIPGDPGMGPSVAVITASATGLTPSDPTITLTLYPGGRVSHGTDSNGNISVQITYANSGDDKTFGMSWDGDAIMSDGFWAQKIRGQANTGLGTRGFDIQFTSLAIPSDFGGSLTDSPESPVDANAFYDPATKIDQVEIEWSYPNTSLENPDGFAVVRTGPVSLDGELPAVGGNNGDGTSTVIAGSVPWTDGITDYSFIDFIFGGGGEGSMDGAGNYFITPLTYTYIIYTYKYGAPNAISSPTTPPIDVAFGGGPDINVTGGDSVTVSDVSTVVLIGEPSGIYTLVVGKIHDTLYNRSGDPVDVKIPNPIAKTGFMGE